uniref:Uncharacterized protein n=1 Tax=Rhizophora mucronata TaxID=61149 RepID=A0A2P2PWH8_RHIMU
MVASFLVLQICYDNRLRYILLPLCLLFYGAYSFFLFYAALYWQPEVE